MNSPPRPNRWLELSALLARWIVGGLFISMGLSKALYPEGFLKLVRQYEILQAPLLLNLVAAGLPWFEVFCGLLLVAGVAVRGAALVSLAMLAPFTAMVLRRALQIAGAQHLPFCAVKFDCGCGSGEVYICNKLLENSALILLCCLLLAGRGRWLSVRFQLFTGGKQRETLPPESAEGVEAEAPAADPKAG